MGDDQNSKSEKTQLSQSEVDAINSYLLKWLGLLGAANFLAIIAGLGYVFGIIPQQAASQATALVKSEIRSEISPLLAEKLNSLATALQESAKVQERARFVGEEANRLTRDVANLRSQVNQLDKDGVLAVASAADKLKDGADKLDVLFNLQEKVSMLESKQGDWPDGHYCILKSGSCPTGFKEDRGALNALWMYKSASSYLIESTFGDSWIRHHGAKDRNPNANDWHGELVISTCCK
jgi:hypothetical protein